MKKLLLIAFATALLQCKPPTHPHLLECPQTLQSYSSQRDLHGKNTVLLALNTDQPTEETFAKQMRAHSIVVIDKKTPWTNTFYSPHTEEGIEAARAEALKTDATILLVGEHLTDGPTLVQLSDGPVYVCKSKLSIKLVQVRDGRILFADEVNIKAAALTSDAASKKAIELSAQELSARLDPISFTAGGAHIKVRAAQPPTWPEKVAIFNILRSIEGIDEVAMRADPTRYADILYEPSTEELATQLQGKRAGGYTVKQSIFDDNTITLQTEPDPSTTACIAYPIIFR